MALRCRNKFTETPHLEGKATDFGFITYGGKRYLLKSNSSNDYKTKVISELHRRVDEAVKMINFYIHQDCEMDNEALEHLKSILEGRYFEINVEGGSSDWGLVKNN